MKQRICSAFRECTIEGCRHKVPHEEPEKGMMRFEPCYDSGLLSACLSVVDGKVKIAKPIKVLKWDVEFEYETIDV